MVSNDRDRMKSSIDRVPSSDPVDRHQTKPTQTKPNQTNLARAVSPDHDITTQSRPPRGRARRFSRARAGRRASSSSRVGVRDELARVTTRARGVDADARARVGREDARRTRTSSTPTCPTARATKATTMRTSAAGIWTRRTSRERRL